MEVTKTECKRCRGLYPENLVLIDEICVYCRADEVEAIPEPQKLIDQKSQKAEMSAQAKAEQELAKRVLARKRLLPFVERFNTDYQAGWVHKDICQRLEKFSEQVANKESPRLMLFMPPRHGKSTLASIAFPAWHLGRHPEHEFISCSYSGSLAMNFSRKVRQLLREPVYKNVFEKGGNGGFTEDDIKSMTITQMKNIIRGWNSVYGKKSEFYIQTYEQQTGGSRADKKGKGGRGVPLKKEDLQKNMIEQFSKKGPILSSEEIKILDEVLRSQIEKIEKENQ